MTKQTKLMTGLLAGAALGAGIALILSSDKNSELKEKVSDWFCDLIENSKDKMAGMKDMVKNSMSNVKA